MRASESWLKGRVDGWVGWGGLGMWIERVLLPHVSEWRILCPWASLFV